MDDEIKRLDFENIIWVLFIITSLLNIFGDNLEKDYLINKDSRKEIAAKKIFIFNLLVALGVYLYFFIRNYSTMIDKKGTKEYQLNQIRVFGSLLFIIGTLCLLYFQLEDINSIGVSNV